MNQNASEDIPRRYGPWYWMVYVLVIFALLAALGQGASLALRFATIAPAAIAAEAFVRAA